MKNILITGGSDGLGKEAASKLKAAGHTVAILGKDEAKTKSVAEAIGCKYVVADISDPKQVSTVFDQMGDFEILINNAAIWIQGLLEENDPEIIKRAIEVNVLGAMYCTQAVLPAMKAKKGGRIINVSSQGGLYAKAERSVYTASKWALTGFTKAMQQELKPSGISVTGFYPGALNNEAIFAKSGNARDMSKALDLGTAADALVYICGLPDGVDVPELGIQNLAY